MAESFPFMQQGWWAEKIPGGGGGVLSSRLGCRKTDGGQKTLTDPGGGVRLPGQWYC